MWQDFFSKAVDQVRKHEYRDLKAEGTEVAEGTRNMTLAQGETILTADQAPVHGAASKSKTAQAWAIKERPFTALGLHVGDMGREGVAQSLRLDVEKQAVTDGRNLTRSLKKAFLWHHERDNAWHR